MTDTPASGRPAGFIHKRSLGQHFLHDRSLLENLVSCTCVNSGDSVVEIGPGFGDMTRILALRCRELVAIETDLRLKPFLDVKLQGLHNVRMVWQDVMRFDFEGLFRDAGPFHVVANIPYYLFTPLLRRLLTLPFPVPSINLLAQSEAADRVLATPRTKAYGPLSVLAQYKTCPRAAMKVGAERFTPVPKVNSVFLVMPRRLEPPALPCDEKLFFRVVEVGFSQRRKTLLNNLRGAFGFQREELRDMFLRADLPVDVRAEALDIPRFAALSDLIGLSGRAAPGRCPSTGPEDRPSSAEAPAQKPSG